MNRFRLLEHTADIGIEAEGETPEQLYEQAALGLRTVITESADIRPSQEQVLHITGGDREELLVNWLSELLFLFETKGLLPAEYLVERAGETSLTARVRGESFDRRRHEVQREVKGVTYHQIRVEEAENGWRARVFLDL